MSSLSRRRHARWIGPGLIALLVIAEAVLWSLARPSGEPLGRYLGQFFGAEAILLLSIGLVLITVLPWVEELFDGIDRAAIWHRRVAMTGLLLLVPHIALSSNPNGSTLGVPLAVVGTLGLVALVVWAILPRWQTVVPAPLRGLVVAARDAPGVRHALGLFGGYERWRALHRTTGLFVAAGFAHGVLDATPFAAAPLLRWSYVGVGGVGLAFYVYKEVLARHFLPHHDYQVDSVRDIGSGMVDIALRPLGHPIPFVAGQFTMVYLEGKDGWHRHPFTIASAPRDEVVRLTVKALGDYTSQIKDALEPGMPAVIGGAHGHFDHRRGGDHQLWIAGGVGVTPFLSWLRALDDVLPQRVDFFYSADGGQPFAEEIREIADRYPSLHVHLVDTSHEGRLTAQRVLAAADTDPGALTVFLSGPQAMVRSFQTQMRRAGVPASRIHREHFAWR